MHILQFNKSLNEYVLKTYDGGFHMNVFNKDASTYARLNNNIILFGLKR